MWKTNIEIGQKFGRLTVIERAENASNGHSRWLCLCECGNIKTVISSHLAQGKIVSCGCYRKEIQGQAVKKHGYSNKERLYTIWKGIKNRCYTKSHCRYKDYGARGVKVCEDWKNDYMSFRKWALENGYADNLTIDRINVNGNYEPSNCRWITKAEQTKNQRKNIWLEYNGEKHIISEWAKITGLSSSVIRYRKQVMHLTDKECLTNPKRVCR